MPTKKRGINGLGHKVLTVVGVLSIVVMLVVSPFQFVQPAAASHTPNPTSVTIAGTWQFEAGCPGDWDPTCAATHLTYDADDDVWQGTFSLPALSLPAEIYEYKATLNDS